MKPDQEFEQRVRTTLDSSVSALDAETRSRLAAARAQAFERKSWLARWLPAGNWIPATALAACAVLAVTLFVVNRQTDAPLQMAQADPDFALELLLGDDDSTDTDADPDFYIQMEAMLLNEEDEQNAG
jgi:anti-sigma-K factor RskA